ncbi:MAG: hypothetical protein ACYTBJ_19370 [Planctomycetota bacterium]|jgi:hypothetical protein
MILEASRQFRLALEHSVYGVNAKLNGLSRYPDMKEPRPVSRILDWTMDDMAVRGEPGNDYPCLMLPKPEQFEMKGEVTTAIRDTETLGIRLSVALITELAMSKTSQGAVEAALIIRAIQQCVATWLSNDYQSDRVANNIQIRDGRSLWWSLQVVIDTPAPNAVIAGGVLLDVMLRDLNPEG